MARHRTAGTGKEGSPALGKTIQRLRKAYNMSLGDLSETSGVAKSIISQIERNETNPTIATVWRLTRALDTSIDEVLKSEDDTNFLEHQSRSAIPVLNSEDGLCTLRIIGALNLVDLMQLYDFTAKPGGVLESEPHQPGTVEHLSVLSGQLTVEIDGEAHTARTGETLRYRGDRPHKISNSGEDDAHATMAMVLRVTVVE